MRNGLPSGQQIEIRAGAQRVVVVGVGAGLRSYTVGDHPVVDGYGEEEMAAAGRGQVLIPWPNRLEEGAYEFAGRWHHLPLNEPGTGNAIHGLVRWAAWSVGVREEHRVVMEHTLHPQPGYPFSLALSVEYAVSDAGLRVTSTATNVGRDACPNGSGAHPYLTVGTQTVDTAVLRAPGRTMLQTDARGIPVGAEPVRAPTTTSARPGRSARQSSTTRTAISSATLTEAPAWSFGTPTADQPSRSGSTRATGTWSCSPATRNRASNAGASPSSR